MIEFEIIILLFLLVVGVKVNVQELFFRSRLCQVFDHVDPVPASGSVFTVDAALVPHSTFLRLGQLFFFLNFRRN